MTQVSRPITLKILFRLRLFYIRALLLFHKLILCNADSVARKQAQVVLLQPPGIPGFYFTVYCRKLFMHRVWHRDTVRLFSTEWNTGRCWCFCNGHWTYMPFNPGLASEFAHPGKNHAGAHERSIGIQIPSGFPVVTGELLVIYFWWEIKKLVQLVP